MKSAAQLKLDSKVRNLTQRELLVFDFDDTLVDCNSDTWIHKLAPGQTIPEHLNYKLGEDYFKHVQSVLAYLHDNKVTEQQYIQCLSTMPAVPGMLELINTLSKQPDKYDMIILSDSNSFFIGTYLKAKSLDGSILTILTNSARFQNDGQLIIDEYHVQDFCSLSARNLCKGDALVNFIGKRMLEHNTVYTCINYIGDGENDLCPSTRLSARDRVFPRAGYTLARLCNRLKSSNNTLHSNSNTPDKANKPELKATIVPWTSGEEILDVILGQTHTLV